MVYLEDEDGSLSVRGLSPRQFKLIWFALGEYAGNLHKTLDSADADIDDEVFCYGELAAIAGLKYMMQSNEFFDRLGIPEQR